jgi:adenine phosphoribosyltransferase
LPIKSRIRTVRDFPKQDILFRDVTSLIADPVGLRLCVDDFVARYKNVAFDLVVGIDLRGFIFGGSRKINASGVEVYCQTQFEGH